MRFIPRLGIGEEKGGREGRGRRDLIAAQIELSNGAPPPKLRVFQVQHTILVEKFATLISFTLIPPLKAREKCLNVILQGNNLRSSNGTVWTPIAHSFTRIQLRGLAEKPRGGPVSLMDPKNGVAI